MNLFVSGRDWLCFNHGEVRPLAAFPRLTESTRLVWAPDRAVTGVAALEGNARHAAVLIERRLRAEGNIEGDVKVFIHQVRTVGQGYQALYSAVPLDEWQRLLTWAGGLPHHCLLLPSIALVWDTLKEGSAAVFQHGAHLVFLGLFEGRILHVNTIAFSDSEEDAVLAAQALGERVRDEMANAGVQADAATVTVGWYGVQRPYSLDGTAAALTGAFASASGCQVVPVGEEPVTGMDGTKILSSIPGLARRAGVHLALNAPEDKWCFQADRYLPACVAMCALVSLAAVGAGANWLWQSRQALHQIDILASQEAAAGARLQALGKSAEMPASLAEQLSFLDAMQKLQAGHDVAGLLAALKTASSPDVRILGIRIEDSQDEKKGVRATPAFLVDGILADASLEQGSALLSFFVRTMRQGGYEIEAVDAKGPAAGASASSRMFSYRVQPRKSEGATR